MKNKKKTAQSLRLIIQIAVFVIVLFIAVSKGLAEQGIEIPFASDATLHAICPFGGVETFYQFATLGFFIQKIHNSSLILMFIVIAVSILFGTVFCGYICPLGAYQEWLGKLGKKLFPKKYNKFVPEKLDRALSYLRYAVLVLVLYNTAMTAKLLFQNVDPFYALFNFFSNEVAISAYIILGVVTLLSLIIERPWCRYLCPYGALLGLFNKIRVFKIRRNKESCISCHKCDKACPMNIKVSEKEAVSDLRCISCHKCTSEASCPVKETVTLSVFKEVSKNEN